MQLEEAQMEEVAMTLFGFAGHVVHLVEKIILSLTLGDAPSRRTSMTPFLVVDTPSTYNVILGHPFLSTFMDVGSLYHHKVKFSVGHLVGEVQGGQKETRVKMVREDQKRACVGGRMVNSSTTLGVHVLEESASRRSTLEKGELMEIADYSSSAVASELGHEMKNELITCLKRNSGIFGSLPRMSMI